MRICKVDGCGGKHDARGYCSKHYKKARRTGEFEVKRCSVDGCNELHDANGYCQRHRLQIINHGEIRNTDRKRTDSNEIVINNGVAIMYLYDTYGNKKAETIFDEIDVEIVSQYKWSINNNSGYVVAKIKGKNVRLHQLIMKSSSNDLIDHQDRDRTNNKRSNLRFATKAQNSWNSGLRRDNQSGIKGVSWCSRLNKWAANITVNNKHIFLGNYANIKDAEIVRNNAEKEYYRQYAYKE